jgi:nucleotide sugar dehydrogenase
VLTDVDVLPLQGLNIAVCPRRDWFADASKNLETLDRIVGGVTPEATEIAAELLSIVSKGPIHKCSYREAEFTKALENAWLHALVMLPTELAINKSGIDIRRVVEMASTHWRLPRIFLGAGCGGRCVPLGTQYLLEASGPGGILEAVHTTERHIRVHVAEAIARRVRNIKRTKVLVLGIAYRENFRDAGNSPGLDIAKYLRNDFGIETVVADPMWSLSELENLTGFEAAPADPAGCTGILLATPHAQYAALPNSGDWSSVKFVLDAQGVWSRFENVFRERGIEYKCVGSAGWR